MKNRQFASDNFAGICPEAWEELSRANTGHTVSYGEDPWTQEAKKLIQEMFETDCDVFFTFNGTAANSLALSSICQSFHSIICHRWAHIETDECGGPEFFTHGSKVLLAEGDEGKMDRDSVLGLVSHKREVHFPKAKVLSLTQATEFGTVYKLNELATLCDTAKNHELRVHMDGARFSNAQAFLGATPADITWRAGVDVLCLGGSKNGLGSGEAVVFFRKEMAKDFEYRQKQAGQLASKMRFLTAPWVGLLRTGAWLKNARHANECAAALKTELEGIPNLRILYSQEANSVFVNLPADVDKGLRARGWKYYDLTGAGDFRFMCSWDTSRQDVQDLAQDIRALSKN